jgi:hypothetical protein
VRGHRGAGAARRGCRGHRIGPPASVSHRTRRPLVQGPVSGAATRAPSDSRQALGLPENLVDDVTFLEIALRPVCERMAELAGSSDADLARLDSLRHQRRHPGTRWGPFRWLRTLEPSRDAPIAHGVFRSLSQFRPQPPAARPFRCRRSRASKLGCCESRGSKRSNTEEALCGRVILRASAIGLVFEGRGDRA